MKQVLLDANFPKDASGATYHVATRPGQVANRIVTVGDPKRAQRIAKSFDGGKILAEVQSQRGYLTLTGLYKGVPVSVVAIGMGFPMVDFFVRECRAVTQGEMIIVRLGSCGSIDSKIGVGTLVVPFRSHGVTRNFDYFHSETTAEERASGSIEPYLISKPLDCDKSIHDALYAALQHTAPPESAQVFDGKRATVVSEVVNASADSFYSGQGRQDASFLDANSNLIDTLRERCGIQSLEMETYMLNHLALSANLTADGAAPVGNHSAQLEATNPRRIRTGAVQMIFADRHSQRFITPAEVEVLEEWAGQSVLEALVSIDISKANLHPEGVWSTR